MKYQAVIFDLDGVICHTDHYHYKAWKKIAEELSISFNENMNNQLRGISRMESLEILLQSYPKKVTDDQKQYYASRKNDYYREFLQGMSPQDLNKEVKNTIEEIKSREIKIAIGSSSKNAKFILNKLGLQNTFDAISDGTNITYSKPNPEVFLKASDYLGGISPRQCLVVEDASSGIEAAHFAQMDSAALGDTFEGNYKPTYYLDNISDLLAIL